VLEHLRAARVEDGILGTFHVDRDGDMVPAQFTIFRVTGRTPPGSNLVSDFHDARVVELISVPATLVP
jgi:hypothetical protein